MLPLTDSWGRIYISTSPVAFHNSGVAYAADGSMVITEVIGANDKWVGAWRLDSEGRVVVSNPGAYFSNEGLPFLASNGAMVRTTDTTPVAADAYVAGIRVSDTLGVYFTTATPGGGIDEQIAALFASYTGFWYDPSDLTTMWQDSAGTTPAVVDQPVGRILDKSGNANHLGQATADRRPILRQAGDLYYLDFDGTNDALVSVTTINLTAFDKLGLFAGVTKDTDTLNATLVEFSAAYTTNDGAFMMTAPFTAATADYAFGLRGTTTATRLVATDYVAPLTNVLACQYDIAQATRVLEILPRIDGVIPALTAAGSANAGGGNFGNHTLYVGARSGTLLPFNGRLYGLMGFVGTTVMDAASFSLAETYMAQKSGVSFMGAQQHVVPLAGQSNMLSRATFDNGSIHPYRTYQWLQSGKLARAYVPLDHIDESNSDMGLDITFAQDYLAGKSDDIRLILVPCADGGSSFSRNDWNEGNPAFEALVSRVNAVMALLPNPVLKGILWHQGETDAIDGNVVLYPGLLDNLIVRLRDRIHAAGSNTPFVVGGLSADWYTGTANFEAVQASIVDTPNRVGDCAYADSAGLAGSVGDEIHFDAAAIRTLGSRYYTALNSLGGG